MIGYKHTPGFDINKTNLPPCPWCKVRYEEQCVTKKGKLRKPHRKRWWAFFGDDKEEKEIKNQKTLNCLKLSQLKEKKL